MTLDEMEKMCRAIDEFDPEETMRACKENDERPHCLACNGEYVVDVGCEPSALCFGCSVDMLTDLARALLLVLPAVRDAIGLYDKAQKCSDRPYMGCPMDHSTIDSRLYDSVEKLRAAMEEP